MASLDCLMNAVASAQPAMSQLTQEQVDRMFEACALASNQARVKLAQMTVEESGMGVFEDKVIKNHFASEVVYNRYKHVKTCGVIEDDYTNGFTRYAEPVGLLAAAIPCTNPTSTAIFKCLLALKARNTIVISPHPRTAKCTIEAARIIRDAACRLGAPENWIGWIEHPTPDLCGQMMKHDKVQMIVATGAGGLVKAAYSSGKPAMGGGSGNTPVLIDDLADIETAVNSVLLSKTFDNGMICASEQAVVAMESVAAKVKQEFVKRGAYFLQGDEKKAVGNLLLKDDGGLRPEAVGQAAVKLVEMAGLKNAPKGVRMLIAELSSVGQHEKLSHEKLSPCIGFYVVKDFEGALARCKELVEFGGMGHTSVLFTNDACDMGVQRVGQFQAMMPTGRTLVNCPTSQGAIGGLFNFRQHPSMTLCCGSWGHNATAESLQVKHLLNIKEVAHRRVPPVCAFPPRYGEGLQKEVSKLGQYVMVTTENAKYAADAIACIKAPMKTFYVSKSTMDEVGEVAQCMGPGTDVVAVGDKVPQSVAKMAAVVASNPLVDLMVASNKFFSLPGKLGKLTCAKQRTVMVPVGSAGMEQQDMALFMDHNKNCHILCDSALRSSVNVCDDAVAAMVNDRDLRVAAFAALVAGLESYLSLNATPQMRDRARETCIRLYEAAVGGCAADKMSVMRNISEVGALCNTTGPSFAETMCVKLMVKMGCSDEIIGACAPTVMLFLAEPAPSKMGTSPAYTCPVSDALLTHFAKECGQDSVENCVAAMRRAAADMGLQVSVKEAGVDEKLYNDAIDDLAMQIFDSEAALCAPRYPLIREVKCMLKDVYHGTPRRMDLTASLP